MLQRIVRAAVYASREALVLGLVKWPPVMKVVERGARRHMASQVSDPVLRERVTPDYEIGCKRMLPSSGWYPAIAQPNVELVTEGIAEVRAARPDLGILLITHYQRILDHLTPDAVHVLLDGRIVATGGPELARRIEAEGFEAFKDEVAA